MKNPYRLITMMIFTFAFFPVALLSNQKIASHNIRIEIRPENHLLNAVDTLTLLPSRDRTIALLLNKKFYITSVSINGFHANYTTTNEIKTFYDAIPIGDAKNAISYARVLRIEIPKNSTPSPKIEIHYSGVLNDMPANPRFSQEYASLETDGIVDTKGVYLPPEGYWYPRRGNDLSAFRVVVTCPSAFYFITRGKKIDESVSGTHRSVIWNSPHPGGAIFLVGGKYIVRTVRWHNADVYTYFYPEDDYFSGSYIKAIKKYLSMYSDLIGPYPFAKFAVVENFLPTGYGMPSYTLLGKQVLRLPFIVDTSLGHEILHNWWGNGVLVSPTDGNWCEGLTSYLADYYYQELKGKQQAASYRRRLLSYYSAFVPKNNKFALKDFQSRTDPITRAVGYNKAAFVFHMLRRQVKDEVFFEALKSLYTERMGKYTSWSDIRNTFETVSKKIYEKNIKDLEQKGIKVTLEQKNKDLSLGWFFDQWLTRTEVPTISVKIKSLYHPIPDQYLLSFVLSQTVPIYRLYIPVVIETTIGTVTRWVTLEDEDREFQVLLKGEPIRVKVDPNFDVFRTLYPDENPPSIAQIFGARRLTVIEPSSGGFHNILNNFVQSFIPAGNIVWKPINTEESPTNVWIAMIKPEELKNFPWKMLVSDEIQISDHTILIGNTRISLHGHLLILTLWPNGNFKNRGMLIVSENANETVSRVLGKLVHYGAYSYLAFDGTTNVLKGTWPIKESPLIVNVK